MTRRELEITEPKEIEEILKKAKVLRIGLVDDGMPYIVPMNYGYTFEGGKLVLYVHSAVRGYKIDVIEKNPVCCIEIESDVKPFEGPKPCMNGMSYSCIMGRGTAEILKGFSERKKAMDIFMLSQTGREYEFTEKMLSAVHMIKIDITDYTAKKRPLPLER